MMSGPMSKPTKRIQGSYECRYYANFSDNLFDDVAALLYLSKYGMNVIATLKNNVIMHQ